MTATDHVARGPDHESSEELVARLPARLRSHRWLLGDRGRWAGATVLGADDAVVLARRTADGTVVTAVGAAGTVRALLAEVASGRAAVDLGPRVRWLVVPRGTDLDEVAPDLGVVPVSRWAWLSTSAPPPEVAHEDAVVRLGPDDLGDVRSCLATANPRTSARPGGPDEVGWWGVRSHGALLGVVGAVRRGGPLAGGGSWHLRGLGVAPQARGRGLGGALVARAVRDGLGAGLSWVSLGVDAANETALRVYDRTGLAVEVENASWGPPGVVAPPT